MATVTLRPNQTHESGSWANVGGAASFHAALADDSDATYAAGLGAGVLEVGWGDLTLPARAQIRSVKTRARVGSTYNATTTYLFADQRDPDTGNENDSSWLPTTTTQTVSGAAFVADPNGAVWTKAVVDRLRSRTITSGFDTPGGGHEFRLFALYLDVVTNEAPTATVTGPAEGATLVNTSRPTVTWTYSDPESDAQERYRVKVFSAAQYGAAGFDPETSASTWDSGEVLSASTSVQVGTALVNDTYRAYVKVADGGSGGRYGAWDNNQFTVAVDPPGAPRLVATAEPASARVRLDVLGVTNMLTENQSSLETDATGWAASTNCAVSRSTAQAAHGSASLQLSSTAAGDMSARTPVGTSGVPVTPNAVYVAMASFRAATTARDCRVFLSWYDSAGALLSQSASPVLPGSASAWRRSVVVAAAPAGAAFAALVVQVLATGAGGEVHYVDRVMLAPASGLNMLTENQSSLETDATGWGNLSNATVSRTTVAALDGAASLQVAFVAGGAGAFAVTSQGTAGHPVAPSSAYSAALSVMSATAGRSFRARIYWFNAAGTVLTNSAGALVVSTTSGWTQATVSATSPADAAFAAVAVEIQGGGAGEVHYLDAALLVAGSAVPAFTPGFPEWSVGGFLATETIEVERSADGGTTWVPVAFASAVDPADTTQAVTLHDHEAPPSAAVYFRARATGTKTGNPYSSGWSAWSSPVTLVPTEWWLKDPKDPSRNRAVLVLFEPFGRSVPEAQRSYTLLAAADEPPPEVTLSNGIMRERLDLSFRCDTQAAFDDLTRLRSARRALLLQAPDRQWYLRIGADWDIEHVTETPPVRFVHTSAVERAGP